MRELRRVFTDRRFWLAMVLILLANLCLFLRQQRIENYGFSDVENLTEVQVYYRELLAEYQNMDLETAREQASALAQEKNLYDEISSLIILKENLTSSEEGMAAWDEMFAEQYESYCQWYPDLVAGIQAGEEYDVETLERQSIAASKLLEQLDYLCGYADYLEQIQASRTTLSTFSIFNQEDSFSSRNIEKTGSDFEVLDGVEVSLGEDRAVTALFSFKLTDYFLILTLAIISLFFLDERRAGLWPMIHATPSGRIKLAARRVAILGVTAAAATLLLYGENLLSAFVLYGGAEDLGRAAQSIAIFQTLPIRTTILGLLARYTVFRMFAGWTLGCLIWLLLSASRQEIRVTLVLMALLLAVEYVLYTYLPVQSIWNLLKYFNVFSYLDLSGLYTRYLNLNLFGYPVGIRTLALTMCLPLLLLFGCGCALIQIYRRPGKSGRLSEKLSQLWGKAGDVIRTRLSATGMEWYKLLIMQGGVVVVILFGVLLVRSDYGTLVSATQVDYFMQEFQGEITEDTWHSIQERQQELEDGIAEYQQATDAYTAGELPVAEYFEIVQTYGSDSTKLTNLLAASDVIEELETRGDELGISLYILYEPPYLTVLGTDNFDSRIEWNLFILFALSLLLCGFLTMEQTSAGLRQLVQTTPRGRGALLKRKYAVAAVFPILFWGVSSALELRKLLGGIDVSQLSVPVQSLTFLSGCPFHMSIAGFLVVLYLLRLIALLSVSAAILLISSLLHKPSISCLAVLGVFVLPTVLWKYIGITPLRWISAANLTDVTELFVSCGGGVSVAVICMFSELVLMTCCVAGTVTLWRRR